MARILVIDDNEDVRAIVCAVLESAGHEVTHAADGAWGLRAQRESPVALVVTDIFMPEKEGLETIRDLRREYPDLKIIAMSGAGARLQADYHLLTAREFGAHSILHKPFEPSALLELVRELLKAPTD